MKVYISSDMEGTAGVVDWNQCLPGEPKRPMEFEPATVAGMPVSQYVILEYNFNIY